MYQVYISIINLFRANDIVLFIMNLFRAMLLAVAPCRVQVHYFFIDKNK